ncbi:MAG: citrate transporter [Betaproteobacteria bacterium]|nr:citrate transporter [Betaproteobacteria bacterium]
MSRLTSASTALLGIAAAVIFFLPPPAGATATTMHAAALMVLTVGLWALGAMPEHVTSLLFFLLAMVFAIASPQAVFSGFASPTMWLVLGGLFIADAVTATGLGQRFIGLLFERYSFNYGGLLLAIALIATALAFFMPATVARMLLIIPIVAALAARVGFPPGSTGYHGLMLSAIIITYQSGNGILPANAPNLVLAGAGEALYGVHLIYGEYLWVIFPVLCLLKGIAAVGLIYWLFPAEVESAAAPVVRAPMTAEEKRLAIILVASIILWATDFIHGVRAGWVALAAAIACMLPRIGVLPYSAFNEVRLGSFFYVGGTIGLGAIVQESGLGVLLGNTVQATLDLRPGADFANFVTLSLLGMFTGVVVTNPAQPAVLAPLAGQFADATGWSIKSALMISAIGFNTMILPYQVPPVVVGMQAAGISLATTLKATLPLAAVGILFFLPLEYLWWRWIGYFG